MKILWLVFSMLVCVQAEEVSKADVTKIIGEYRLEITYSNKGTRSEGMDGKLFKDGKEIAGKDNDVIKVDTVVIKYYGTKREYAWATTGWNLDPKMKYSWIKD